MILNEWIDKHAEEKPYIKIGTERGAAFLYCGKCIDKQKIMELSIHIFNEHYNRWQRLLTHTDARNKERARREEIHLRAFQDFGHRKILSKYKVNYGRATVLIIEGSETLNIWDDEEQRDVDMKIENEYNQKERKRYERRTSV